MHQLMPATGSEHKSGPLKLVLLDSVHICTSSDVLLNRFNVSIIGSFINGDVWCFGFGNWFSGL